MLEAIQRQKIKLIKINLGILQHKSHWSRGIERQSTNTTQVKNKSQSFTSPKPGAINFILKPYTNMSGMKMLSVNCKQSFGTRLSKSLFY